MITADTVTVLSYFYSWLNRNSAAVQAIATVFLIGLTANLRHRGKTASAVERTAKLLLQYPKHSVAF